MSVEQIIMNHNKLGDDGAAAIASVLPQLPPTLATLGLQANFIGPQGCAALATGLKRIAQRPDDATLAVYVSFNNFGSEGARCLKLAEEECKPWLKVVFS